MIRIKKVITLSQKIADYLTYRELRMKILIAIPRTKRERESFPFSFCLMCIVIDAHTHARTHARARSAAALRVRKVRRVTRRANDDDTLISPGGRGSFFKGQ